MTRTSKKFPGVEWIDAEPFIKINNRKCAGCANCIKVCIAGCYEISNNKAIIRNLDYCMECGACWYVCLQNAITFSWPAGGTGFKTNWG